jgi:hypothetical protein
MYDMFTQHPRTSEFFDLDSFTHDNITALRDLYEQACNIVASTHEPMPKDEFMEHVAICVAAAVYADINTIVVPIRVEPANTDALLQFAVQLVPVMTLFSLEALGHVQHSSQGFSLTPERRAEMNTMKVAPLQ